MARGKRRNGVVDFMDGFNSTYGTTKQVLTDYQLNKIANEKPETTTAFSEDQGEQLRAAADSGQYDVNFNPDTGNYDITPKAGGETGSLAPGKRTTFLGKTVDGEMSQQQVDNARLMAMSGVYSKMGNPEKAMKLRADAGQLEDVERKRADDAELRAAMPKATDFADNWWQKTGPRTVVTLLQQGKLAEAGKYAEFLDTEQGRNYANTWLKGVRAHSVGDSEGALKQFEKLYNDQHFDDGHTVELTPLDGGKRYQITQIGADGSRRGMAEGTTAELANNAAMALSPASYVKFMVEDRRAKEKVAAQLRAEEIRQQGREASEDRRDERLAKRLQAESERRSAGGGLSTAQQRGNAEIDAARETVAGLTPEELRKRTAKTTDTGRENPNYDPSLARASSLAARRKVGSDDWFDQRNVRQQERQAPAYDRSDIAKRFRADRAMDQNRLGKDTPKGVEVLDKSGRVIGYYD